MDTFSDQYIKKWCGLPRCATTALIHLSEGMNVQSISSLYIESHSVSHSRTRLQGDAQINHVLDTTLQREQNLSKIQNKLRTTTVTENTFREVLDKNLVDGEIPIYTGDKAKHLTAVFNHSVQKSVKNVVTFKTQEQLVNHVKNLTLQGNILTLAAFEKEDIIWKSYMYSLKAGTLKFLLNASIDTLPTAVNLKRWKKSPSDVCKLCRGRQTTNHVLNACKIALNSKRYTWRHDSILSYIVSCVDTSKFKVHSDLPGHQAAGGGSIPPEICVTNLRPDIVVIDVEKNIVNLFELTCPSEENINLRNQEKSRKYSHFLTDIPHSTLTCFEVSSKGFLSTRNHTALNTLYSFMKPGIKLKTFKQNISVLSVYSSYHIWLCRSDPAFTVPPPLPPPFSDKAAPTRRGPDQ